MRRGRRGAGAGPLGERRARRRRRRARTGRAHPARAEQVGRSRRFGSRGRLGQARTRDGEGPARMSAYAPMLAALLALLVGLTIGKAWERYKLRDGSWIDRRRVRESPHYILGLNFLVANQIDLAIEELTRAAILDGEAVETQMILGNLYRVTGQVGKAITD